MAYWIASLALVVFGFLSSFSIGQPFFLVGLAMLVLGAFRGRPFIFWPPLLAVVAYNLAFVAVAPLYCTGTFTGTSTVGSTSTTVCSNLIGVRYSGEGIYNPSLLPAVAVGLIVAGVTAIAVFAFLLWKRRTRSSEPIG
jgi:hypothetical protein